MTWNKSNIVNEPQGDNWGGPWTEKKLVAFSKYVAAYLNIMKKNPHWKTIYFDGFAGSGTKKKEQSSELYQQLLITEDEEKTYKGAAERVLSLEDNLAFDFYYFIDKEEKSLEKLQQKLSVFTNKEIQYRAGDANTYLLELGKAMQTKQFAALVLLDPFGMQIDWSSIEQLKGTRSDVWILVPTGVIVNRLLEKSGELKHIEKLVSFFGISEQEIRKAFYTTQKMNSLFDGEVEIITKISNPIHQIAKLYAERMKTVWKFVTEEPLRLDNRNGVPIFHFVFASNNQNATKIAKQIIKNI